MKPVAIVTDSTSDLPPALARQHDIHIVACNVHFGTEVYREHVDLDNDQFFEKLRNSPQLPTTSQPSVGAFLEVYRALATRYAGIVSIHLASSLSGTMQSATLAAREIGDVPVEVIDSESVSMGIGWLAIIGARAAISGASLEEISKLVQDARGRTRLLALLENLDNALKGGRIGRAEAMLGTVLSVKPILDIGKGEVKPLEKVRTWNKALLRLTELVQQMAPLADLAVLHARSPQQANSVADRLSSVVPREQILVTEVGAVLGTHAGFGAIGVAAVRQPPSAQAGMLAR